MYPTVQKLSQLFFFSFLAKKAEFGRCIKKINKSLEEDQGALEARLSILASI